MVICTSSRKPKSAFWWIRLGGALYFVCGTVIMEEEVINKNNCKVKLNTFDWVICYGAWAPVSSGSALLGAHPNTGAASFTTLVLTSSDSEWPAHPRLGGNKSLTTVMKVLNAHKTSTAHFAQKWKETCITKIDSSGIQQNRKINES